MNDSHDKFTFFFNLKNTSNMCVYYTLLQKIITGKCERKINHGKCSCTDFLVRFGGFSFSAKFGASFSVSSV